MTKYRIVLRTAGSKVTFLVQEKRFFVLWLQVQVTNGEYFKSLVYDTFAEALGSVNTMLDFDNSVDRVVWESK